MGRAMNTKANLLPHVNKTNKLVPIPHKPFYSILQSHRKVCFAAAQEMSSKMPHCFASFFLFLPSTLFFSKNTKHTIITSFKGLSWSVFLEK